LDPGEDASMGGFVPTPPADDAGPIAIGDAGPDATVTPEPACGRGPATDKAFSKPALLESFAERAVLQICEFETLAPDFAASTEAYATDPSDAILMSAKNAWYFAMQRWQVAEM